MRDALKTALLKGTIAESTTVDGTSVRFRDRKELRDEYQFWCREVARERGERPSLAQMDLSGAFDA